MTLGVLAAMSWHVVCVSSFPAQVLAGSGVGLWAIYIAYRLYKTWIRGSSAKIIDIRGDSTMIRIDVILNNPSRIRPGQHFNIFFSGSLTKYLHSHSSVAFWHLPDVEHPCRQVSNVSFLLSREGDHTTALSRIAMEQRVRLEGPFGKNLHLRDFENVILAAKGIGIAGILPLALELAERKRHDEKIKDRIQVIAKQQEQLRIGAEAGTNDPNRNLELRVKLQEEKTLLLKQPLFLDGTKKLIVFWSLELNSQMDIVKDQLSALQDLDPENVRYLPTPYNCN
jgi:predicted ferric reductase